MITGDDILIEYVRRLKNEIKKINIEDVPSSVVYYLDKFINHKVWSTQAASPNDTEDSKHDNNRKETRDRELKEADLYRKLKIRYREMQVRREQCRVLRQTTTSGSTQAGENEVQ